MTHIQLKKTIFRFLFGCEIIGMVIFYFFGAYGYYSIKKLRHEKNEIEQLVQAGQKEIDELQMQICDWKTSDFMREKIAREQLHMARSDELVIYLN